MRLVTLCLACALMLSAQQSATDRLLYELWVRDHGNLGKQSRPVDTQWEAKYLDFRQAYDKFDRKLQGCRPIGFEPCQPEIGRFDSALWNKVCRLAREVFVK